MKLQKYYKCIITLIVVLAFSVFGNTFRVSAEENYASINKYNKDFLRCLDVGNTDGSFQPDDVTLGNEKGFWLSTQIKNNSLTTAAENVRVKYTISKVAENEYTITSTIFFDKGEVSSVSDSLTISASEPFNLEYDFDSSVFFTFVNNTQKSHDLGNALISDEGALVGSEKQDGIIAPDGFVNTILRVSVTKNSDIEKLKNSATGSKTVKAWNMLQKHCDPKYFRKQYRTSIQKHTKIRLKGAEYKKIAKIAKDNTKGITDDYEKMKRLAVLIADRVYYDYPLFNGYSQKRNSKPYYVWKNKKAVCQGYSNLYWTMLDALGIPCMQIRGKNHVYNAAYYYKEKRWVVIDVTWMSGNQYTLDKKWKKGTINMKRFDMDLETLLTLENHEIFELEGVLKKNVYYTLHTAKNVSKSKYMSEKKWYFSADAVKNKKKAKNVKKLYGYKVKKNSILNYIFL